MLFSGEQEGDISTMFHMDESFGPEPYKYLYNTTETDYKIKKDYGKKKTIHIVPHTHDDLGWLNTIDDYFYGRTEIFYFGGVTDILTTSIH